MGPSCIGYDIFILYVTHNTIVPHYINDNEFLWRRGPNKKMWRNYDIGGIVNFTIQEPEAGRPLANRQWLSDDRLLASRILCKAYKVGFDFVFHPGTVAGQLLVPISSLLFTAGPPEYSSPTPASYQVSFWSSWGCPPASPNLARNSMVLPLLLTRSNVWSPLSTAVPSSVSCCHLPLLGMEKLEPSRCPCWCWIYISVF